MNQTQVSCFLAAAKAESFSEASDSVYMTPPTFGRQISSLEQELGFPLFERGWKNNKLTPAGEIMYEGLTAMSAEYTLLVNRALRAGSGISGTLTLGMLEGQLIDSRLREAVGQFQAQYPAVSLELQHFSFQTMLDALKNGTLDAGITLSEALLANPDLQTLPLYTVKNEIVMAQDSPLAQKPDLHLADFSNETFIEIGAEDSPIISGLMLDSCRRAGFVPRVRTVRDLKAQIIAVELGQGVAAFNRFHQTCNHPGLCHRPLPELPDVEFSLVWEKSSTAGILPCLVSVFQETFQQAV